MCSQVPLETSLEQPIECTTSKQQAAKSVTKHQMVRTRRRPICSSSSSSNACSLFLMAAMAVCARAQCPLNTMTTFERTGGVTVKDASLTVLYSAPNMSSYASGTQRVNVHASTHDASSLGLGLGLGSAFAAAELTRQLTGGAQGAHNALVNIPITAECNNRCRRSAKCRAFLVDYARHTCYALEQPGAGLHSSGLSRAPAPIQLLPTQERTAYFEKVCFAMPMNECERAWVFERVLGYHLHAHDDKIIEDVSSRLKCQEYCLQEQQFKCRSGEYDSLTGQCRLSMYDRHSKSSQFRATTHNVDYFENQCAPAYHQCDSFERYEDVDLGRAEIMRSANTSEQCQHFCTHTIKAFVCRSFTWNPQAGKCYLSSVNTFMVGGIDRLMSAPGVTFYQRNDCIDLRLECDSSAMTLQLRTAEPFRGRMYVRDDPNACETLGRSSLSSSLSIPFHSHARCATRELPSRYSSVVVVQQHPMIQRKTDRYVKVVCDFQTANRTITSTYNVVASPWTSTALINSTSFAPKIRLRITDKYGVDITGAKLGDELYLRIEAESESVYDMVARSVLAKSGATDESILLIDKDGCPTDSRIFPTLKKMNRRTIVGRFDAFKFSSDVVVRFQVDVQFCIRQCPMSSCDQGQASAYAPTLDQYSSGALSSSSASASSSSGGLLGEDSTMDALNAIGIAPARAIPGPLASPTPAQQQQQQQQHNQQISQVSNSQQDSSMQQQHQHQQQHAHKPMSGGGAPPAPDSVGAMHTGAHSHLAAYDQAYYGNTPAHTLSGSSQSASTPTMQPHLHQTQRPMSQQTVYASSMSSSLPINQPYGYATQGPAQFDSQAFDSNSALRIAQAKSVADAPMAAAQQTASPKLDDGSNQIDSTQSNSSASKRRRRALAEQQQHTITTRHVPLQREIIVEPSAPSQTDTQQQKNAATNQQQQQQANYKKQPHSQSQDPHTKLSTNANNNNNNLKNTNSPSLVSQKSRRQHKSTAAEQHARRGPMYNINNGKYICALEARVSWRSLFHGHARVCCR